MVALVWALLQAILSLLWLVVESALGWHEQGVVHAHEILWFIIPPVCAVGAMVHDRYRTAGVKADFLANFLLAFKTGVLTTLAGDTLTLIVWFLYISVLDPDFFSVHEMSAVIRAKQAGMNPLQTEQILQAARVIFSVPAFYVVSAVLPLISGIPASLIAAFGIRRRA